MKSQLREQALQLRIQKHLSYREIKKQVPVAKSTLSLWLRDFPLAEEEIKELRRKGWNKSEAGRERFRTAMRRKRKLKDEEVYDKYKEVLGKLPQTAFFVAGLMLYLGEGSKKSYSQIALANTDPKIIKFFIQWLNEFLDVPKQEMRVMLHLYEDMDIKKEMDFWKNELQFGENQFYKSQIRKLQKSSFSYPESYRHGTCSVSVGGVERKRELMMAMQAFLDVCGEVNMGT